MPQRDALEKLHAMLDTLSSVKRGSKPRTTGLTVVLDKLQPVNEAYLACIADCVDYAKIGWGLSLVAKPDMLGERLSLYKSRSVHVMPGGTLLELAEHRGIYSRLLGILWEAGFDAVEVSSGAKMIPLRRRIRMIEEAARMGFRVFAEVGRKKPSLRMDRGELVAEIGALLEESEAWKVVIESREHGRNSCLFDGRGELRRDVFEAVVSRFDASRLVFEAPLPHQQAVLLKKLGPEVNLGNIGLYDVPSLETLRRGLRGDTFATGALSLWIDGPPSAKFVYFVLERYGMLSTRAISSITGLPARTVYDALRFLRESGLVDSVSGQGGEKKWYTL